MKFSVNFRNLQHNDMPVNKNSISLGLSNVREIREIVGCELPLDRIEAHVCLKREFFTLDLTEDQAIESNLFENVCTVTQCVPTDVLNDCVEIGYMITKDPYTCEVIKVQGQFVVNPEKVYNKWKASGFDLSNPENA